MKSKKWVLMALLLSFVPYFIFSFLVLNFKNLYMNQEYPMWNDVKNKIYNNSNHEFDILYIGDSRAKAGLIVKDFEVLTKLQVLNLTIGGSTPIEGYYSIKEILKNNQIDKIILSYAPFHIAHADSYWHRTVKFEFFKDDIYEEIYQNALKMNESYFLERSYKDYKIKIGLYLTDFQNGIRYKRWIKNYEVYNYLNESKGHYYFGKLNGTSDLNSEASIKLFKPLPLIDFYLKEIVKLANEYGIKIFWFTMPFNKSSFDKTSEQYIKEYNIYINSFSSDNFIVLNSLYYKEDKEFGDPSHLYLGAKDVTLELSNLINILNK